MSGLVDQSADARSKTIGGNFRVRAWINFNGATPSINGSGNVSSLTRHHQGDFEVNFSSSMPDANYCVTGVTGNDADQATAHCVIMGANSARATGSVRFRTVYTSNSAGGSTNEVYSAIAVIR